VKFAKYHALGNDYLVLEPGALGTEDLLRLTPLLCHRNYGNRQ
jgi:diaminopimelate epimerase